MYLKYPGKRFLLWQMSENIANNSFKNQIIERIYHLAQYPSDGQTTDVEFAMKRCQPIKSEQNSNDFFWTDRSTWPACSTRLPAFNDRYSYYIDSSLRLLCFDLRDLEKPQQESNNDENNNNNERQRGLLSTTLISQFSSYHQLIHNMMYYLIHTYLWCYDLRNGLVWWGVR